MTLEEFTIAVKADELWLEAMRNPSRGKSLAAAIEKVYGQCISDQTLKSKPMTEHRKHIFNTLGTQKYGVTTGVQLQQEPIKKELVEQVPVSSVPYEVHQKRLQDLLNDIAKIPSVKRVPKLSAQQIAEEGGWEKKREMNYKPNPYDVIRHNLKIEYARTFSNPMSFDGRLLPGSPSFEDWMEQQLAFTKLNKDNESLQP